MPYKFILKSCKNIWQRIWFSLTILYIFMIRYWTWKYRLKGQSDKTSFLQDCIVLEKNSCYKQFSTICHKQILTFEYSGKKDIDLRVKIKIKTIRVSNRKTSKNQVRHKWGKNGSELGPLSLNQRFHVVKCWHLFAPRIHSRDIQSKHTLNRT